MPKLTQQWLEVFRSGDFGDKGSYSDADLDTLVANYDPAVHEAPLTVGHPQDNKPAYGWVESLKRVGSTLFAKFKQVDPQFEEMVAQGKFKKRSISFYKEPKLMLRHIGFLGAMPPEVKGLADPVFHDSELGKHEVIEFSSEEGESMDPKAIAAAIKDAFNEVFGGKKPSTFSEDDVTKMVTSAVEKAVGALNTTITGLQKDVKDFTEKATSLATSEATKARAIGLIAPLKQANKWIPAFDEMGLGKIVEHLVTSDVKVSFGEGAAKVEKTLAEAFTEFLGALPAIVPLGKLTGAAAASTGTGNLVKFNDPGDGRTISGGDLAEAAQALAFSEKISYGDALKRVRAQGLRKEGATAAGAV